MTQRPHAWAYTAGQELTQLVRQAPYIHKGQKVDATQVATNWPVEKGQVASPHRGIVFDHKKQ